MTAATTTASNIKEDVIELSKAIKPHLKITEEPNDPSRGLAVIEGDVYVANLPEGVTVDLIKKVQAYDSLFIAGTTHAFGEAGIKHLEKHKGQDRVTLSVPTVGKDTMDFDLRRSSTYPSPQGKPGETITKFASVTAVHTVHGTRNIGDLKKVKTHLAELGAKHLANNVAAK